MKILLKELYFLYKDYFSPVKENVFKTSYGKHALISFITSPFTSGIKYSHTNYLECMSIAKVLHNLGFNIDVVQYASLKSIKYSKYKLIIGFGEPLENYFLSDYFGCADSFFYSTGCNTTFSNKVTLERIKNIKETKGAFLPYSSRYLNKTWRHQVQFSNCIIVLGNTYTEKTYNTEVSTPTKCLPLFYHKTVEHNLSNKDFESARKNYLWFGGKGLVHKGLDICLEIFKKRQDINLHICGPISSDKKFCKTYEKELYNTSNIINHDFVDITSSVFSEILSYCAFTVFPSISEGSCPSVLTVMGNGGLIPIISEACGLDIEDIGFTFKYCTYNSVINAIEESQKLNINDIKYLSNKVKQYTNKVHSLQLYQSNLKNLLQNYITK